MAKRIQIVDLTTGEVEVDTEANGGYCLQYSTGEDSGRLHIVGQVQNARYGNNLWIKNWAYYDTLYRILQIHNEHLKRIEPNRILF